MNCRKQQAGRQSVRCGGRGRWGKGGLLTALTPPKNPPTIKNSLSLALDENKLMYMTNKTVKATKILTRFMRVRLRKFLDANDDAEDNRLSMGLRLFV